MALHIHKEAKIESAIDFGITDNKGRKIGYTIISYALKNDDIQDRYYVASTLTKDGKPFGAYNASKNRDCTHGEINGKKLFTVEQLVKHHMVKSAHARDRQLSKKHVTFTVNNRAVVAITSAISEALPSAN